LYFQEVEDWFNNLIPAHRIKGDVIPNRSTRPLDISMSSLSLRNAVITKYGESHVLSKNVQSIDVDPDYRTFFDYVNKHDKIRRLNWRETFPDVAEHYDL
jgi:hypothetical protein